MINSPTISELRAALPTTKVGIHAGLRFDEYRAIPALNMSTLLWGKCSAAHLKAAIEGKIVKDSKALAMGRAFHVRVLEPDIYSDRVVIKDKCDTILKSGPNKGSMCGNMGAHRVGDSWFCGSHKPEHCDDLSGYEVIDDGDADAIEGMRASVMAHPIISQIRRRGGFETTVLGNLDGELCKVRFDKLITEGRPIAIDLKKCRLGYAKPSRVDRTIEEYSYHNRAAFYLDVLEAAGGPKADTVPFILVFVEDEYPHAVSCHDLTAAGDNDVSWIDIGRAENQRLIAMHKAAKSSGVWPAYTDEQGNIDVRASYPPEYIVRRHATARIAEPPQLIRNNDDAIVF